MSKKILKKLNRYLNDFQYEVNIQDVNEINRLKETLQEVQMRKKTSILVMGTMKAGKSTLVNALLGTELMPNENSACTLVPTEIELKPYKSSLIGKGKDEDYFFNHTNMDKVFHGVVRDERKYLEANKQVRIQRFLIQHPLAFNKNDKSNQLTLIDTPGINEMKAFQSKEFSIGNSLKQELQFTELYIYVINIEYFKEEENERIIKRLVKEKQDLSNRIIFVINKKDELQKGKGVTLNSTIAEIKRILIYWGVKNPYILAISAKEAMYARWIDCHLAHSKGEKLKLFAHALKDIYYVPLDVEDNYLKNKRLVIKNSGDIITKDLSTVRDELYKSSNFKELELYIKKEWLDRLPAQRIKARKSVEKQVEQEFIKHINKKVRELQNQRNKRKFLLEQLEKDIKRSSLIEEKLLNELKLYINYSFILNELKQQVKPKYFLDAYLQRNRPEITGNDKNDQLRHSYYHEKNTEKYYIELLRVSKQLEEIYKQTFSTKIHSFALEYQDILGKDIFDLLIQISQERMQSRLDERNLRTKINYAHVDPISPHIENRLIAQLKVEGLELRNENNRYLVVRNEEKLQLWEIIFLINGINNVYQIPDTIAGSLFEQLQSWLLNVEEKVLYLLEKKEKKIQRELQGEKKLVPRVEKEIKKIDRKIKKYKNILK